MSKYFSKIANFIQLSRNYLIVLISLLFSMLTGYLRQTSIAYVMGVSQNTDIFLVTYAIPEFVFIALPIILTPAIIPFFTGIKNKYGEIVAWTFVKKIFYFFITILLIFILLNLIFRSAFLRLLSPGFDIQTHFFSQQVFLIMLPGMLFMGLAALMGAFLQVYKKFARPILMTAVYNLFFIATLFLFPDPNSVTRAAWGVTLGSLFAFLFQIPLFIRYIPKNLSNNKKQIDRNEWMRTLKFTAWISIGYLAHHLIYFVDRSMATYLGEGKVAILNFAYHLSLSVGQISGLAISMVVFPNLSEKISSNLIGQANQELSKSLRYVISLSIPITLGLLIYRYPLVRFLYEYGEFSSIETQNVSNVLIFYAVAVFFDAICQPFWRYIYAFQKGRIVLGVNLIQTSIRVIANYVLIQIMDYNGIALSAALGIMIQMILLGKFIQYKYKFMIDKEDNLFILRILISSLFSAIITNYLIFPLTSDLSSILFIFITGILYLTLIVVFYFIILLFLKNIYTRG